MPALEQVEHPIEVSFPQTTHCPSDLSVVEIEEDMSIALPLLSMS
jgi:hypothetical protein